MKFLIFILVLLSSLYNASCQISEEKPNLYNVSPNAFNLTVLGNGAFFSLNYERRFILNKSFYLYSQLGIGYNEEFSIPVPCLFGPCGPSLSKELYSIIYYNITANTNINKVFKYLEIGIGSSHALGLNHNTTNNVIYAIAGLRIQMSKNISLKYSTYIPINGYYDGNYIFFPLGFSLGINL